MPTVKHLATGFTNRSARPGGGFRSTAFHRDMAVRCQAAQCESRVNAHFTHACQPIRFTPAHGNDTCHLRRHHHHPGRDACRPGSMT